MNNLSKKLAGISIAFILMITVFAAGHLHDKNEKGQCINEVLCAFNSSEACAKTLFLDSWKAIKDEYFDRSFNHQKWQKWREHYIDYIETMEDAYIAIDSMLESLDDPYTRFLDPVEYEDQNMNIDAKLFGIGVNIAKIKGNTVVVDVLKDTPAQKAELKVGDILTKVSDKSLKGLTLRSVAELVRGEVGTNVDIEILRKKERINKKITREEIDIKSVESKMLDNKMAYIKISSFLSQETAYEFAKALIETKDSKGIIIDLRGNHGGLLPNAIFIANMFLKDGKIVSIVDQEGNKEDISASAKFDIYIDKPVVILVNGSSASASEILSGALKDHGKATLVGETTYGKGLVQKIYKLSSKTGMNITIARYLTPKGSDINKVGIKPDVTVEMKEEDFWSDRDPQLDKAKKVLAEEVKEFVASK